MVVYLFFVTGLLVGSFITVIVVRYDSKKSVVWGRSECPQCHATIRWYDNIPVISFLILRGRCRNCHIKIGIWYPITELTTAVVFAFTAWIFLAQNMSMVGVIIYCIIFTLLIIIFVYDWQTMQIPMEIIWLLLCIIGISVFLQRCIYYTLSNYDIQRILIGGIVGFGFLFFLSFVSQEKWMGGGDAYIGLIGGLLVGWPEIIFLLTVAFGIGACIGVVLLIQKKKQMQSAVPFAPFLVIAIFITIFIPLLVPSVTKSLPYFS